ncbi:hypothetical protein MNEG_14370 [Monoraphidium neglectum]|uniref:Exportin-1/Importin-beta-like domain-containing protein n=1 Tax=Monoraphidium neglectum TaxID=145388 RepID=A0A0D2LVF9_9CHLO|nr:hypothetical protein MNEG_14370 [Monoraphidium neglectum]KIY93591.1 hypothetical protein MNEG_14370 [Monoraphidium neglectum]|eukprot:XP_013892611.1 hypothetical protein MNEG_14370 [Monoraphidium neglectum]
MQAAAQQLADSIVSATAVTHNAASTQEQRTEAVRFFEQLKHGEIHSTVFAAAVLTGTQYALEVQVSAYSLLQYLVRNRWGELAPQEQQQVTQLAYQHLRDVGHLGAQAAWALKSKAAMLLAGVVRQQGPEGFGQLLPQLIAAAGEGPMQAEISCLVLQFVAEDIMQFEDRTGDWRRSFLSALLASVDTVFPALVKLLQDNFSAGVAASQSGRPDAARAHAAVVNAALGALSSYVEWAPLGRVGGGSVVEACAFFLNAPDFRDAALGVLKQVRFLPPPRLAGSLLIFEIASRPRGGGGGFGCRSGRCGARRAAGERRRAAAAAAAAPVRRV